MRRSNLAVWLATLAFVVGVSKVAWAGNPVNGTSLLNLLVFALPLAGIYALSAAGLVVVYTTTGIFNFAQGAIGMLLAYFYWELRVKRGLPTWLALVLTVLVAAPLIGVTLDRLIMRHLQGKSLVAQLTVTIGLMFAFIGLANMIWDQNLGYVLPSFFGDRGFHIGDVVMTWHRFITLTLTVVLAVGLRAFLFGTRSGIAMRAVVDNRSLAGLSGARSEFLSSFAWALGCALAALAGIFLAPESGMATGGPLTLLIITAFAAAVVGRLRSLPMTYVGALLLALAVEWSQLFLQFGGRWGQLPLALPTVMLFIVLLLLPSARLQFARINVVRHSERVSSVRDTVVGMAVLLATIAAISTFLSPTNMNRFALGMCTALVALSLVPLIGWAGQVSLAPLAFAGIGAVAYTRLGGMHGHWYAVVLAALLVVPVGALLALPAMRLQGLYLALATMAFASMVEFVFFTQPWALGTQDRKVQRLHLFGAHFASTRSFLLLVTAVFGLTGIGVVALRRSALGRRFVALRDSEAASATVGVNILETKVLVFMLSAGMAGFAGAFMAQYYETVSGGQFQMLAGLSIVLALVIGGVATVAGALFAGMFGLGLVLVKDNWHLSLWKALEYLAPGLAAIGIIQNPSGAVVAIGEGFAPLLPWRKDARRDADALREANAEPEVGNLGLARPFSEADVLIVDRALGITNDVPRATARVGSA
ncbi:MAG: branched-chain amino acid ABC-type transport system, permease component [Actinomycetia bacterium]|nr:branched-chain amino acid ABC-type transport system, permease component [Actinomycetes bacterium]